MTDIHGADDSACPSWNPPANALTLGRFGDGTDGRRIVLLATHPTWSYFGEVPGSGDAFELNLQKLAFCYLKNLKPRFEALGQDAEFLPDGWMDALDPAKPTNPAMMWLPLDSSAAIASRDLVRDNDQTIVLVAGHDLKVSNIFELPPNGFGVRVVMRRLKAGEDTFAVSSMTAHLPDNQYDDLVELLSQRIREMGGEYSFRAIFPNLYEFLADDALKAEIAAATGQEEDGLEFTELRATEVKGKEVMGAELTTYGRKTSLIPPVYPVSEGEPRPWPPNDRRNEGFTAIVTRVRFYDLSPQEYTTDIVGEWPLHAHADVRVFTQVPVAFDDLEDVPPYSFFPRPSHDLEEVREVVSVPSDLERLPVFRIRYCPDFVRDDELRTNPGNVNNPYKVVLPGNGAEIHPRSELQSAVSAFYHFNWFFDEVNALGLDEESLLRYFRLPLMVHYRSGISPGRGKDGQTVNARVALTREDGADFIATEDLVGHVHLALGNINRWFRDVPDDGAFAVRAAQPLGIANDRRWIIHEIGHLMIAGALGELELRFVHSVGDALAAVLSDPESRISEADPDGPWVDFRYQTFPWVDVQRRHDRSVLTGWSWSGDIHREVLRTPELQLRGLKGYGTEQILSTALFRLYQILGGDTVKADGKPDVDRRRTASRVVLYLVLRGLETFVHWPLRAEELESAMIDADICLTTDLTHTDPIHGADSIWTGGQAHKVIRWAFEAQGLHPEDTRYTNNGPGAAPPVDIYVKDLRRDIEHTFAGNIDHRAGSYVPVSLHWSDGAEWISGRASLGAPIIELGERRGQVPVEVRARVWIGQWDGNDIVNWDQEFLFDEDDIPEVNGDVASLADLGITVSSAFSGSELVVLLEISCPEDRANTDPAALLGTAIAAGEHPPTALDKIAELVATDNNLGFFWVTV